MRNHDNQPNGRKKRHLPIECRLTTEHERIGENGRILLLFFDGPPTTLRQINPHHCIEGSKPDDTRERIKGKDCETMTKIEIGKRTTLTCGRPLASGGSGLLSLRISNRYRHRHYRYIRLFNTVVLNVLTKGLAR